MEDAGRGTLAQAIFRRASEWRDGIEINADVDVGEALAEGECLWSDGVLHARNIGYNVGAVNLPREDHDKPPGNASAALVGRDPKHVSDALAELAVLAIMGAPGIKESGHANRGEVANK